MTLTSDEFGQLTLAVREADKEFETVGGSSRHWVRDCFLPALERHGLTIERNSRPAVEHEALASALEFLEARDRMNAAVHESEVRWSPLTETVRAAVQRGAP